LSIKGSAHFYGTVGKVVEGKGKKHVITTQTEHKCVLDSCRSLEQEGYDVTYLPVQESTGMVDMEELEAAMREDTFLVSVMAVNNEIGTRQPVEEIGALCRNKKILFHTDGRWSLVTCYFCFVSYSYLVSLSNPHSCPNARQTSHRRSKHEH
jgi:cysteine desulfurase